ncbi:MAG: CpsD/CapB family tyrosine-protein kinase [Fuscovulum sp.]|jgi:Mrp family chromosome partitioning ATPase|nr:MAG: CpsD/CapB family tyrosine-protein kinase [Fuscovulum sp.]
MAVERVQSAIARARAQRAGLETVYEIEDDLPMAEEDIIEPVPPEDWNALPKSGMTARILDRARIVTAGLAEHSTAFDMMRTKVLQRMKAEGWKRIAITSADKNCGKSMVAMNLAFSLSRQVELRTILVEADLRQPSLAKAMRLSPRGGFAEVLRREVPFPKSLVRVRENLAVLANRDRSPASAELLHSDVVPGMLKEIERAYRPDVMIFDLPPLMLADDTLAFLGNVDCALLVTSAEHTTTAQVEACVREISDRTALVGVVLNKYRAAGAASGY